MTTFESIRWALPGLVLACAVAAQESVSRGLGEGRSGAERLASHDPARVARALEAARGQGASAARAALEGFESAPVAERRARAGIVRAEAGRDEVPRMIALLGGPGASRSGPGASRGDPIALLGDPIALLGDPIALLGDPIALLGDPLALLGDPIALLGDEDAVVRAELVRGLARPDLARAAQSGADPDERALALARLALEDPDTQVRAAALAGLTASGDLLALERAARTGPAGEREAAQTLLAAQPAARDRARAAIEGLADAGLPLVARLAAEGPEGKEEDAALAAIGQALARGSGLGVAAAERYARRLVQLGADERALRGLRRLRAAAEPAIPVLRARIALARAGQPRVALEAAAALRRMRPRDEGPDEAVLRVALALRHEACARILMGECGAALAPLDEARRSVSALAAARRDAAGAAGAAVHVRALLELAQIELAEAIRALAAQTPADPAAAREAAWALHGAALAAQAAAARAEIPATDGIDRILSDDDSALELVLDAEPSEAFSAARQIELRLALGRALATAAPDELIGFEPLEVAESPQETSPGDRRRALLGEVLRAELARAQSRHGRASLAVERARRETPGGVRAALVQEELEARLVLQEAWNDVALAESGDETPMRDQRSASWLCVTSARVLRENGRGPEARELLARARQELEASGAAQRWLWGIEMVAEIEAATGASYTDDEEPSKAEMELLRAVERLRALEDLLRERGAPQRALEAVRNQRANALVSLAVNANVRMGRPDRALEHFEAAWELRQDEFTRVLLACYRARSGRADEARAALATVVPGPGTYYNVACARALLGERDEALQWLERELRENHAPGGSLERQKAWARKDPDLASLRDDPRFRELVDG